MSSLTLIDSSAWIFALGSKPDPEIRENIKNLVESNRAAITSPILFELLSGAHSESDSIKLNSYLTALHPFPFVDSEWHEAAEWTRNLRRKGVKAKTIDALIAFKALKHNLILLHADADLDRIARKTSLRVESFVQHVRNRT